MNPLDNPDIVGEILAFTDRIPRHERVSRTFQQITQPRVRQLVEYMDRYYPLWDKMDLSDTVGRRRARNQAESDRNNVQSTMIRYLLNRAAINQDWDVFMSLVDRYRYRFGVPEYAISAAIINDNIDVAREIHHLYLSPETRQNLSIEDIIETLNREDNYRRQQFNKLTAQGLLGSTMITPLLDASNYNKQMLDEIRSLVIQHNIRLLPTYPPIVLKYMPDLWPKEPLSLYWQEAYISGAPIGAGNAVQRYVISEAKDYPIPQDIAQYLNL